MAAQSCTSVESNCFLPKYASNVQPLKAIDYDDIEANKTSIRDSYCILDISGTLVDCSSAGSSNCIATSTYITMDLSALSGSGLTNSNFNSAVASASSYEFWDASGARHTITGNADLSEANI